MLLPSLSSSFPRSSSSLDNECAATEWGEGVWGEGNRTRHNTNIWWQTGEAKMESERERDIYRKSSEMYRINSNVKSRQWKSSGDKKNGQSHVRYLGNGNMIIPWPLYIFVWIINNNNNIQWNLSANGAGVTSKWMHAAYRTHCSFTKQRHLEVICCEFMAANSFFPLTMGCSGTNTASTIHPELINWPTTVITWGFRCHLSPINMYS